MISTLSHFSKLSGAGAAKVATASALILAMCALSSCAGTEQEEVTEGSIPPPDSASAETLATLPTLDNAADIPTGPQLPAELPPLEAPSTDLSESGGWKMKDPTKDLATDRDLAPSMNSLPLPTSSGGGSSLRAPGPEQGALVKQN